MNAAARLIFATRRYDHVTPLLEELHRLRARQRITYKLAMLSYRCLHGLARKLTRVADIESRRHLRCAATEGLETPSIWRPTIGGRAFPAVAAEAWNGLLTSSVTSGPSLETSDVHLKLNYSRNFYACTMTLSFHFCWLCIVPLQFSDDNVTLIVSFLHYITLLAALGFLGIQAGDSYSITDWEVDCWDKEQNVSAAVHMVTGATVNYIIWTQFTDGAPIHYVPS